MLFEMHCHSSEHSSCSSVPAVELVRQVWARGLDGLVLTDHHFLWSEEALAELRREAEVPANFVILSGQEVHVRIFGDVLIYGAPIAFPRGASLTAIRLEFPQVAVVWAHPYRDGREPAEELLLSPLLNAVEIFNSNHTVRGNSRGLKEWRRYGFTATGGTDTHGIKYVGIYPTFFDTPVRSVEELVSAISDGRCRPYLKEIVHREASKVTEVAIGTEAGDETREGLIIRTPSSGEWSKAERAFHIMSAFSQHGFDKGTFRVPHPIEKDTDAGTLIEQGVTGVSLFDKLSGSTGEEARTFLQLSAQWLARLHRLRLQITSAEQFLSEESRRLDGELVRFTKIDHPYARKLAEIVGAVKAAERELVQKSHRSFVQGHGDYHPKNILIAYDVPDDAETLFIAAIDFERSQFMPPAFDVGWFLAQTRSQFAPPNIPRTGLHEDDFLEAYVREAGDAPDDFFHQVELFRARANVSIAAFFVKLGMVHNPELWRLLVEAERALVYLGEQ